jgi:hypothetical protein
VQKVIRKPPKYIVYIIGIFFLGVFYPSVKQWLGDLGGFLVFLAMLLVIRLAAERLGR